MGFFDEFFFFFFDCGCSVGGAGRGVPALPAVLALIVVAAVLLRRRHD